MAQFYKELKELRISKEITLEDLQSKTKININIYTNTEKASYFKSGRLPIKLNLVSKEEASNMILINH